jgi:hypothetical protein
MEQSAVKQRQANSKEGSVAVTESNMKPTEKVIHAGNEEGAGEEPEEDPLTASQFQTQEFQQLNEELYKMEDDFAEDIEGQFTLDTIRNGIGRVAT